MGHRMEPRALTLLRRKPVFHGQLLSSSDGSSAGRRGSGTADGSGASKGNPRMYPSNPPIGRHFNTICEASTCPVTGSSSYRILPSSTQSTLLRTRCRAMALCVISFLSDMLTF